MTRFSSLAFLTGAGLSAADALALAAALTPSNPPAGSLTPSNPPAGSLTPSNPPASGLTPSNPPAHSAAAAILDAAERPQPSAAPAPRQMIDPSWVYASPQTLLAQALRRSNAKVQRPSSDGRATPARRQRSSLAGTKLNGSDLWRWGSAFRVKAVAAELLGRYQVHNAAIWLLDPTLPSGQLQVRPMQVFALPTSMTALTRLHAPLPPGQRFRLDEQIDKTIRAAVEREDRLPEILSQEADCWPFFEALTGLSLLRAPLAGELLQVAHEWALHLIMHLKHQVAARRPVQESSLILPVIATPGHGSLPSGHATLAALNSELLHLLLYSQGGPTPRSAQLDRLARRIAFNRVAAGVHFPVDSQAGYRLGTQLARLLAASAGISKPPLQLAAEDVLLAPFELVELELADRPAYTPGSYRMAEAPALRELWREAAAEVEDLRV